MNRLTTAIAALGFVAATANAAVKTQYFYQADADKNVAQATLDYYDTKINVNGGSLEDAGVTSLLLNYERGINEMFSAGITLPYQFGGKFKETGNPDMTFTGMGDMNIYGKGTYALADNQNLHYGLGFDWSLGSQTFDQSGNKMSAQDGRFAITPYVGYVYGLGSWNVGAKLYFDYGLTKAKENQTMANGTTSANTYTGGDTTTLSIFGEMPFTGGLAGAALAYRSLSPTKTTFPNGGNVNNSDGENFVDIDVYGTYDINEMITLVGDLGYSVLEDSNYRGNSGASGNTTRLWVAARYTF